MDIFRRIKTVSVIQNAGRFQIGIPMDFVRHMNLVKGSQVIMTLESDGTITMRPNDGNVTVMDELNRLRENDENADSNS